eukprot:6425638-Pyramimonas_sp.AAC.1
MGDLVVSVSGSVNSKMSLSGVQQGLGPQVVIEVRVRQVGIVGKLVGNVFHTLVVLSVGSESIFAML